MLTVDMTHKTFLAALNKLVFDINLLAGHFMHLAHSVVPAESESFKLYSAVWKAFYTAAFIVLLLPTYGALDCKKCSTSA